MADRTSSTRSGRAASRPSQLRRKDWKAVLLRIYDNLGYHNVYLIAAGVAFYGVLALFPAIGSLVALYGLMSDRHDVAVQLESVRPLLPPNAYQLVASQLEDLTSRDPQALSFATVIAFLFALWSARAGVNAMIDGININYNERNERGFIAAYALSLVMTAIMLVVVGVAIFSIVVLPPAVQAMDFASEAKWLAQVIRWPILLVIAALGIGALYRFGPQRKPARTRWISLGSVLATALWLLASYVFSWYVSKFADYNATYGSLGAIVGLMMWFYISAYIVLLGAELDAEMEHQTRRDTTAGPERPIGDRGAFVADHVPGEPRRRPRTGPEPTGQDETCERERAVPSEADTPHD